AQPHRYAALVRARRAVMVGVGSLTSLSGQSAGVEPGARHTPCELYQGGCGMIYYDQRIGAVLDEIRPPTTLAKQDSVRAPWTSRRGFSSRQRVRAGARVACLCRGSCVVAAPLTVAAVGFRTDRSERL